MKISRIGRAFPYSTHFAQKPEFFVRIKFSVSCQGDVIDYLKLNALLNAEKTLDILTFIVKFIIFLQAGHTHRNLKNSFHSISDASCMCGFISLPWFI